MFKRIPQRIADALPFGRDAIPEYAGGRLMAEKADWVGADTEISVNIRSALEWRPEEREKSVLRKDCL